MKREIFVGDLQGCCKPLERLLEKLNFDPATDRLRFAGDLVNRGGESLETLRLVHSLKDSAMTVLGNHDLHLLAYAHGVSRGKKKNPEFEAILSAPDGTALLEWLRCRPFLWMSSERRLALVHAGVDPRWDPDAVRDRASELEQVLLEEPAHFFSHMYGNFPQRWEPDLPHDERMRSMTNVFTRMRFCDRDGWLDLDYKGGLEDAPAGVKPWFEYLHPDWNGWTIVFGHWSQLGLYQGDRVVGLDTGCVWGGELTALVVNENERRLVSVECGQHGRD